MAVMEDVYSLSDAQIEKRIGEKTKAVRLKQNITPDSLGKSALLLFATFSSLFFRKVDSLPYSSSGFFLGRPLLVSFFSIVFLFSIL